MTLRIRPGVEIPEAELEIATSRSSGPGGQHVNKTETRVTLRFDLLGSPSLTDGQKRRLVETIGSKLSSDGVLAISVQDSRSQRRNREVARERLAQLLREGLVPPSIRKPTRVPPGERRRRLDAKRRRSSTKNLRGRPRVDED